MTNFEKLGIENTSKKKIYFPKNKSKQHFTFFMHTMDLASYIFYILDFDQKHLDL